MIAHTTEYFYQWWILHLEYSFFISQLLKHGEHQLVLQHVTLESSGVYSCQITLSGPPFDTVNKEKTLEVYGKFDIWKTHENKHIFETISR